MMNLESVLKKHNLTLPNPPAKGGVYEPVKEFGSDDQNGRFTYRFAYLSGCTPSFNGEVRFTGKVGAELSVEQGQEAARLCILNLLANLKAKYGSLDKVKRIVKMTAFVASAEDFYEQPKVANGGSELLVEIFGEEAGRCSRSAIGVYTLPGNAPVEIEIFVELA
jgi:enamine deaminase RidA (YjgF/YER057c/UK114 family)